MTRYEIVRESLDKNSSPKRTFSDFFQVLRPFDPFRAVLPDLGYFERFGPI